MTKKAALSKAADAAQMMHVALGLYGEKSSQYEGAVEATRSSFLVARAHGATDADLRALKGSA